MSKMSQVRTYHTRLKLTPEQLCLFEQYAHLYGHVERSLYADVLKGKSPGKVKPTYCSRFGITARQFNGIAFALRGKMRSLQAGMKLRETEYKQRIARAKNVIQKLERKAKNISPVVVDTTVRSSLHHKKRRLKTLEWKLSQLQADRKAGISRICFGSKKLFQAQFYLAANGYQSHEEWRQDWQAARCRQFFVLGSKDESSGNQSCTIQHMKGHRFRFRLRLPNAICGHHPVHTVFETMLPYGAAGILSALKTGQAISYRFVRDEKSWRLFISTDAPVQPTQSQRYLGTIGLDINRDHLAVAEVNRHGNVIRVKRLPLVLYGCSQEQSKARIGDTVQALIAYTLPTGKPLVIEKLDFSQKKAQLESQSPKAARMLSSFAYSQIIETLKARAYDAGIEVIEVNPAYTSLIGHYKFQKRYGISSHQAAALTIARRGLNLSEKPNRHMKDQVTFPLPVRNRRKHVWSFWHQVSRKAAAHAAHRQPSLRQAQSDLINGHTELVEVRSGLSTPRASNPPGTQPVTMVGERSRTKVGERTTLSVVGGTPARESSAALFG